jgi:hypothetical protein
LAANFQRPARTASLLPSPTAAIPDGILCLKLRILAFFADGFGASGPPSPFLSFFRVSSL